MTRLSPSVRALADWSRPVPLLTGAQTAPQLPGVYLLYCGSPRKLCYVGMAGERRGKGLRQRLQVYCSGKGAVSGFGEAAFDRALADPSWVSSRLEEARAGAPLRAKALAALAVQRLEPVVRWTTTSAGAEARQLERAVEACSRGLWNR